MNQAEFIDLLSQINVSIDDAQMQQLNRYYEILVEWNEFMNLTGITEYDQVLLKHFADSLALKKAIDDLESKENSEVIQNEVLNMNQPIKIMDVGTGAGFPGLPIKIAFPKTQVFLLDSLNKRIKFLNEVITQLQLKDITANHGRAEEFAQNKLYRENFDMVVSRAVANLATLVEYCLPFVKTGGYFIAYKSGEIEQEVNDSKKAIKILGGEVVSVYKFQLPGSDIDRSFVFIKKVNKTAKEYPRKAGLPGKEPLC